VAPATGQGEQAREQQDLPGGMSQGSAEGEAR